MGENLLQRGNKTRLLCTLQPRKLCRPPSLLLKKLIYIIRQDHGNSSFFITSCIWMFFHPMQQRQPDLTMKQRLIEIGRKKLGLHSRSVSDVKTTEHYKVLRRGNTSLAKTMGQVPHHTSIIIIVTTYVLFHCPSEE